MSVSVLKDIIVEKWKECFKSGDKLGKSALELIKARILVAEKSGEYTLPLSNDVVENIIIKEIKELKESQTYFKDTESVEYLDIDYKVKLLSNYLPKQMSEDDVISIIKEKQKIESNMGKLIGLVVKEVGNKFDKSKISILVKELLLADKKN